MVITALINTIVSFKLGHISNKRLIVKTVFWIFVFIGLFFTENIYNYLYSEGLTQTEPLSLFDVIQITGVIYVFYLVNRLYVKVDVLERRNQDLHQELSIILSEQKHKNSRPKK